DVRIERVGDRSEQEGVTVCRGLRDARRADVGARARTIDHHHLLSELLGELVRDDAREHVGRTSWSRRRYQGDRTGGVVLPVCNSMHSTTSPGSFSAFASIPRQPSAPIWQRRKPATANSPPPAQTLAPTIRPRTPLISPTSATCSALPRGMSTGLHMAAT